MCDEGEDQKHGQRAQVAGPGQHRQARHAATGQNHPRTEGEAADKDREPGQVGSHEAVVVERDQARADGRLRADQGDGEGGDPDAKRRATLCHRADETAAQAETRDLGQDAESEADQKAEDDGGLTSGGFLEAEGLPHGDSPQDGIFCPDDGIFGEWQGRSGAVFSGMAERFPVGAETGEIPFMLQVGRRNPVRQGRRLSLEMSFSGP